MKRVLSIILMMALVLAGLPAQYLGVYAADTAAPSGSEEPIGYIETEYDDKAYTDSELASIEEMAPPVERGTIPESYNSISNLKANYPASRSQAGYGTCWAFSVTACAEFDLVTEGAYTKDEVDFSELQLAYNTTHTAADKLGNLSEDELTSESRYLSGNNTIYTQHILANWKGYTSESTYPYSGIPGFSPGKEIAYLNDYARLVQSQALSIANHNDAVKQAIMEHGAVGTSYYHDARYYARAANGERLYYYPISSGTNHAVAMVGWDDNFSAENWPESNRPSSDGAWLIRNSHADTPYFWMSYEDKGHNDTVYLLDFTTADTYDNIYQHDGSPVHSTLYLYGGANVFTAQNPDAEEGIGSELLEAVMISKSSGNAASYKIEVYTNLEDPSDPTSGTLEEKSTTYSSMIYAGISTVELENPVYLKPGLLFQIQYHSHRN